MNQNFVGYGYDGSGINVGDRVELHPGTDLWMRGARYGQVVSARCFNELHRLKVISGKCRVQLDRLPRAVSCSLDRLRNAN